MLGAIAGDIAGSAYEWNKVGDRQFPLFPEGADFTDDSVLTIAVADAILQSGDGVAPDYRKFIHNYGRKWTGRGYGGMFRGWLASSDPQPYNSFGNGSAMRVSPVAWAYDDEKTILEQASRSADVTHNHPEGIKGAQSVALAIFLARSGKSKDAIRSRIESEFGYDLQRTVEKIKPGYSFDVTCQGSVPESIIAFLDSDDFEGAVRNAIWLGGDADTQACIAGSVAEAFYGGVPASIESAVRTRVDAELLVVVDEFKKRFPKGKERKAHSTNRAPTPGDAVLVYKYRQGAHEDRPTGIVFQNSGPAVGGGFYVILESQDLIEVEKYDEKRKAWIAKRPRA